ncbi:MAG: hypothetical protein F6K42_38430 [Leptolyngbya sp. SIO1D8]|nr:hypothetical protein [Leptolyngbya sp. SIO1D8]
MKRTFAILLTTSCLWAITGLRLPSGHQPIADAQPVQSEDLFYTYFDEAIELTIKPDTFAVRERFGSGTRDLEVTTFASRLQEHLFDNIEGTRGGSRSPQSDLQDMVSIDALGLEYALVSTSTPSTLTTIQRQVQAFPDTDQILPVLVRDSTGEEIILPNEMLVAFELDLSQAEIDILLAQQDFAIVRPLAFAENHYLVQSTADGVLASLSRADYAQAARQLLAAVTQLEQVEGVIAASPNFIPGRAAQRSPLQSWIPDDSAAEFGEIGQFAVGPEAVSTRSISPDPFVSDLRPLQWHLHGRPLITCLQQQRLSFECLSEISMEPGRLASSPDLQVLAAWQQGCSICKA